MTEVPPGTIRPASAGEQPPPPRTGRGGGTGAGRRPMLTEELLRRIVEVVRVGNYLKTAAAYCGVGYSTLMLWQQKGRAQQQRIEDGHPPDPEQAIYLQFVEQVSQAESQAQVTAVAYWRKAMADPSQWRAAMEYLARKAPEQWAASSTVHVADADSQARIDTAVEAALSSLSIGTGELPPTEEPPAQQEQEEDP
jgi:hypothetical protein